MTGLLDEHQDHLLGPLGPLVLRKGLTIERGFATQCVLKDKCDARHLAAVKNCAELGLIRVLEAPLSFAIDPALRNLRRLVLPRFSSVAELAVLQGTLPIDALDCYLDDDEKALMDELRCVPQLAGLNVICPTASDMTRLIGGPLVRRLARLSIDTELEQRFN